VRLVLTFLLLLTSTAFADPYTEATLDRIHELRHNGEFGGLQLQELTKPECETLVGNIVMGGAKVERKKFVRECTGTSISILQQVEAPELPLFVDAAIVTYINYGNIPFAVERPQDFFANGNLFYDGIFRSAKTAGCMNWKMLQEERIELSSRFMVNEILAYDVRITYKEMGIVSIRYFLNGDTLRYDYNYTCE
jgi:hypothetical protein